MPRKPPKKHESEKNRRGYAIETLTGFANVNGVSAGEAVDEVVGEAMILIGVHFGIQGLLLQDVVIHPTEAIIEVLHQDGRSILTYPAGVAGGDRMIGGDARHPSQDQCLVHYLAQLPHHGAEEAKAKNKKLEDVVILQADPCRLQDGDTAGIGEGAQAVVMIVQDP